MSINFCTNFACLQLNVYIYLILINPSRPGLCVLITHVKDSLLQDMLHWHLGPFVFYLRDIKMNFISVNDSYAILHIWNTLSCSPISYQEWQPPLILDVSEFLECFPQISQVYKELRYGSWCLSIVINVRGTV